MKIRELERRWELELEIGTRKERSISSMTHSKHEGLLTYFLVILALQASFQEVRYYYDSSLRQVSNRFIYRVQIRVSIDFNSIHSVSIGDGRRGKPSMTRRLANSSKFGKNWKEKSPFVFDFWLSGWWLEFLEASCVYSYSYGILFPPTSMGAGKLSSQIDPSERLRKFLHTRNHSNLFGNWDINNRKEAEQSQIATHETSWESISPMDHDQKDSYHENKDCYKDILMKGLSFQSTALHQNGRLPLIALDIRSSRGWQLVLFYTSDVIIEGVKFFGRKENN